MADSNFINSKFNISEELLSEFPELINLILETESMEDDERQYWFDIMPSMNDQQIDRLFNILDTEKKKIEALEDKYKNEIKELNEKHLIEWQEFQLKGSKDKIKQAEAADNSDKEADDILQMLDEI